MSTGTYIDHGCGCDSGSTFNTATITSVSASTSSVLLLAANVNRRQIFMINESSSICRIAFGTTASSTVYTIIFLANQSIVLDFPAYDGVINGIWDIAVGNMRITEVGA